MRAQQAPALVNPALLLSSAVGQSRCEHARIEHAPLADSGPAGIAIAARHWLPTRGRGCCTPAHSFAVAAAALDVVWAENGPNVMRRFRRRRRQLVEQRQQQPWLGQGV